MSVLGVLIVASTAGGSEAANSGAPFIAKAISYKSSLTLKPLYFEAALKRSVGSSVKGALNRSQYHPSRVIVAFDEGVDVAGKAAIRADIKAKSKREVGPKGSSSRTELVELKRGTTVEQALAKLRKTKGVVYAEPDYRRQAFFTPSDPSFTPNQWHLNNSGQTIEGNPGTVDADIDAPEGWDIAYVNQQSTIAVIDSGIDLTHPDLSGKLWQNSGEIAGNGIDDDGNGYVDDKNGYNWGSLANWEYDTLIYYGSAAPDTLYSELAQSFVSNGGQSSGVWFVLAAKFGTPADGIGVSIRSSVDGSDLAYKYLPPGGLSSGWNYADFSTPITLSEGSVYYLVLHTNSNDYLNSYAVSLSWQTANGGYDMFPDGSFWLKSASWANGTDADLTFEVLPNLSGGWGGRPRDDFGHGTHVSGIAAASTNNSVGVAGVAGYPSDAASIMPLRVFDTQGWTYSSNILDAIYYAVDNGADVINMSLGGTGYSAAEQTAVDYAVANDVVVVAAAGNDSDSTMNYPAGYTGVLGVGATNNTDSRAPFSNYNASVDISAPGADIFSTMPGYAFFYGARYGDSMNYDYMSGTSMATPVVAGVAALIKAKFPALTSAQIQQLVKDTADDLGSGGRDDEYGWGRVNLGASLIDDQKPTDPGITGASPSKDTWTNDNTVYVSWAGASDGLGSGIDGYSVSWSKGSAQAPDNIKDHEEGVSSLTSAPLSNGDWYFNLRTVDNDGNWTNTVHYGPFKIDTKNPVTRMVTPFVSTRISKTTTFKVKWSATDASPSSGIDSYTVRYRRSGSSTWQIWKSNTTATEAFFKGKAGVTYYFRTVAYDNAGNRDWSKVYKTIVPFNEGMSLLRRIGFFGYKKLGRSQNYLSSVRYSYKRGHTLVYKLRNTNGIGLIVTKGPKMGRAKIYVDGKLVKTVDAHKSKTKARQLIYYKGFKKKGVHWLKVVNLGTPGRARFEVDGVVVKR